MEISTIGFTHKSAEQFFEILKRANIHRVIDIRLNNTSQLAAFTKRDDLKYFLDRICNIEYLHETRLAPTQEALDAYKKEKLPWPQYEVVYRQLLRERRVESTLSRATFDGGAVLLCSEAKPDQCHRRLAVEYLAKHWKDVTVRHL